MFRGLGLGFGAFGSLGFRIWMFRGLGLGFGSLVFQVKGLGFGALF